MRPAKIIDTDVHTTWRSGQRDIHPYLSEGWREFVLGPGERNGPLSILGIGVFENPHGFYREDALGDGITEPVGPDAARTARQLLDPYGVEHAICTFEEILYIANLPNPYLAAEVARAANDWLADEWLAKDARFAGSILIANQVPELAVKEIHRCAENPRFVSVLMANNGLGVPFGHPMFHGIYAACEEHGFPIAIHAFQTGGVNPVFCGGGHASYYIDYHTLTVQGIQTSLVSFITHGVFEKFPNLKLVLNEGGVSWLPPLMWRFDQVFERHFREVPWMTRRPSEYLADHVRLTTQPFETARNKADVVEMLDSIGARDLLLFASDYPHWDADEATYLMSAIPESWHEPVMYGNARSTYRWPATIRDLIDA